jgi:hypothetical protein
MCHAPVTGGVRSLPKRQGNEREAQTLYVCFGAMGDFVPSRNAGNKEQRRCLAGWKGGGIKAERGLVEGRGR